MAGEKFDADKPRMELLEPEYLRGTADVLTYGARKYAAENWRAGIDATRLYGALQRHLNAFWSGEDIDFGPACFPVAIAVADGTGAPG